jgi:3-mercaptopyruvate sulfurtransferase SseA
VEPGVYSKIRVSPRQAIIEKNEFFFSAHIPQAQYFDQLECTKPTKLIPRGVPEIKCFESYLSRLGVSNNDHIVLYDRSPMGFYASTRAWWLLKVIFIIIVVNINFF